MIRLARTAVCLPSPQKNGFGILLFAQSSADDGNNYFGERIFAILYLHKFKKIIIK